MSTAPQALALAGGGARAAYQAGVLKALVELDPTRRQTPFPLICGVSGGSPGALILAARAGDFPGAVEALADFWTSCRCRDVFRIPGGRIGLGLKIAGGRAESVLDMRPAREWLGRAVNVAEIAAAIDSAALYAVSVGAFGHASRQTVHFFQGRGDLEPWRGPLEVGAHVTLGQDHLAAAFAMPLLAGPIALHREYFCDAAVGAGGAIGAAGGFGAGRILSIDANPEAVGSERRNKNLSAPLAQSAGLLAATPYLRRPLAIGTKAEILHIVPSQPVHEIARTYWQLLPRALRALLDGIEEETAALLGSLLLFEAPYTRALIDLGYRDALGHATALRTCLGHSSHNG